MAHDCKIILLMKLFQDCDWVQCLRPPIPPKSANLEITDWFGEPLAFGEKARYVCMRGMYFEDDSAQEDVKYTCQVQFQNFIFWVSFKLSFLRNLVLFILGVIRNRVFFILKILGNCVVFIFSILRKSHSLSFFFLRMEPNLKLEEASLMSQKQMMNGLDVFKVNLNFSKYPKSHLNFTSNKSNQNKKPEERINCNNHLSL